MPTKYDNEIKKPNTKLEWTSEMLKDLLHSQDIGYFISLLGIEYSKNELEIFDYILESNGELRCDATIEMALVTVLYLCNTAPRNNPQTIFLVSKHTKQRLKIMDDFKELYKNLPYHVKQGVERWTRDEIVFEGGSRFKISPQTTYATRGWNVSFCIAVDGLDEKLRMSILPSIYTGGKLLYI